MIVADVTKPSLINSKISSFIPSDAPKSSAFIMSSILGLCYRRW